MKKILNIIKKYLILVNLFFLILIAIFYHINRNKFDTYATYLLYDFQERRVLSEYMGTNYNFIDFYLSDIQFSYDELYKIKPEFNNFENTYNPIFNFKERQIRFNFNSKKNVTSNSYRFNSVEDKHTKVINDFLNSSLEIYHNKLKKILYERKQRLEDYLDKLVDSNSTTSEKDIMDAQQVEINEFLSILENGDPLVIVKGYNSRYRKLFLNTKEYVVSCLILLVLLNFLILNYRKILK
tara:strand:+ start:105 stop:821 length:717 start_codon:yes stop_codon:yes gene_type:complete